MKRHVVLLNRTSAGIDQTGKIRISERHVACSSLPVMLERPPRHGRTFACSTIAIKRHPRGADAIVST
jgi:hypothetical protein